MTILGTASLSSTPFSMTHKHVHHWKIEWTTFLLFFKRQTKHSNPWNLLMFLKHSVTKRDSLQPIDNILKFICLLAGQFFFIRGQMNSFFFLKFECVSEWEWIFKVQMLSFSNIFFFFAETKLIIICQGFAKFYHILTNFFHYRICVDLLRVFQPYIGRIFIFRLPLCRKKNWLLVWPSLFCDILTGFLYVLWLKFQSIS